MRTAAVQFAPVFCDIGTNLNTMGSMVREAASQGAQLIVLPELCTAGFSFQSTNEVLPFAETLQDFMQPDGPASMNLVGKLSGELGVAVAWGLVEKDRGSGNLYNTQVLMLPDGSHHSYRKINRFGNDFIWATEGNQSPPVAQFLDKKIGMLICRDAKNKGSLWTDFYEKGDADIVCFSANWGDGGIPSATWVKFATTNKTWFVVGNRYGQERNNNFGEGGVCIIDPEGKVYCSGIEWSEPCIVYADVP